MRRKNVFWGIALLAGAAALLLNRLGLLGGIGFWPMVFNIALLTMMVKGVTGRHFEAIMFPLAGLIIVNDELLGLEAITPWPVLVAAFLGTAGLNLLFPRFGRKRIGHPGKGGKGFRRGIEEYDADNGRVSYANTFGDSAKYVSGVVSRIDIENVFGSMQVYLTETLLENHMANVKLEDSFGSVVIYVPSVWKVVLNVETAFGGVEENGKCNPFGEDVVYIDGDVSFGSLEVVYVGEEECAGSEAFRES